MDALLERMQIVIVPTLVWRPGEEPVPPVVSQDHAVGLQRLQDDLVGAREAADIDISLESEALPHGRHIWISRRPGLMPCWPDRDLLGLLGGKAQGMGNRAD